MSTYSLRIPEELMREAKRIARENDTSLNQFFLAAIAERVGTERARKVFATLAGRANPKAFRRILDRVPNAPPLRGDELP
jgi:hypothetical protein